jgi:hypothetical protein
MQNPPSPWMSLSNRLLLKWRSWWFGIVHAVDLKEGSWQSPRSINFPGRRSFRMKRFSSSWT